VAVREGGRGGRTEDRSIEQEAPLKPQGRRARRSNRSLLLVAVVFIVCLFPGAKKRNSERVFLSCPPPLLGIQHFAESRNLLEVGLQGPDEGHDVVGLIFGDVELGEDRREGVGDDVKVLRSKKFFFFSFRVFYFRFETSSSLSCRSLSSSLSHLSHLGVTQVDKSDVSVDHALVEIDVERKGEKRGGKRNKQGVSVVAWPRSFRERKKKKKKKKKEKKTFSLTCAPCTRWGPPSPR
jgi:hypothetical protein